MDEIEFRKRVYANPQEISQEILHAASTNPAYQKILDETLLLEQQVSALVNNVPVPEGLAERLLAITSTTAEGREASKPSSTSFFQYYAMAASLLLAVGIGAVVTMGGGPSQTEIAFGSEVIQHLYHEVNRINAINDGSDMSIVAMPVVIEAMAQADSQFNDEAFLRSTPVHFARPCIVLPAFHSAHLMLEGSRGAVNVIVINNSPVATEFSIQDDRFHGVVVPMTEGNLILIGEQDENLDELKSMFAQNVGWAI